jgi:hypothetical protein
MKTDWINYRPLKEGEIIQSSDHELSPEAREDGWDEVATLRVGTPARDPLAYGHMKYRRSIHNNSSQNNQ